MVQKTVKRSRSPSLGPLFKTFTPSPANRRRPGRKLPCVRQRLRWLGVLPVLALLALAPSSASASTSNLALISATPDYPSATWVPADPSNYSVADRTHDYPIDMIVIHDIEGTASTAVRLFRTPGYAGSAHYVIDYDGSITQMVQEKDIAWHAGNWDYNTRAIGVEHAGFAATGGYTTAEYQASAQLVASICSRYGVPMDRAHVIGHSQVPDPNHPGLYGGVDHHTDPGPYWNWNYYMYYAQVYAGRLPSPPHMMTQPTFVPNNGGATVSWVGQTCHLPIASYTVTVQPGNIVQTLPGTATSTTITGLTNGQSYTVTVKATNADGSDSNSATVIPSPACTAPTLTPAPPTGATGSAVTLSATAASCTNPTYQFWVLPPGGTWYVAQDYGASNTFSWGGSATPGAYRFEVDTRQQTSSVAYDAVHDIDYSIAGCTAAHLTADSAPPQPPGTTVNLTGSATCPGTAQYRFWRRAPGGAWTIVKDYSSTNTLAWNTTGFAQGTYYLEVDARDQGATSPYEAVSNMTYALGPAACHSPTLTASPASPGASGSPVTFTSSSTGCPNPRYRFWIRPPGGAWTVMQNYGTASTFNWSSAATAGTYHVDVDVRDAASTASYDAVNNISYVVTGCSAAQLATDKPSPQLTGTASVTLTGSATCPGTPDYRFWVRRPGGAWTVVQDYSPTATYAWNTASLPAGTYFLEVDVRDHGSTASYETVKNMSFTLGGCISATLTPSPTSPQPAGTAVTLAGSATCTGTPQYRFWMRAPGGTWTIVQDYSASATFNWNSSGWTAGTYSFEVDVRNTGSTATYETVANITFVLS